MTITAQTKLSGWRTSRGVVYGMAASSPVSDDAPGQFERLSRGFEPADVVDRVLSWKGFAKQASRAHKVPLSWILAVLHIESNGNQNAVSPAGAVGLMQIMPETAALYSVPKDHLFHPGTNIFLGARILRDLSTGKGPTVKWDLPAVASMYNAGPAAGEVRPKESPDKPFGMAEDVPYIYNVCCLNNYYSALLGGGNGAVIALAALFVGFRFLGRAS